MKNRYFSRGEIMFALMLACWLTWSSALQITAYTRPLVMQLGAALCALWLSIGAVLWLLTLVCKRSLFGRRKWWYFPVRRVATISAISSALFGGLTYLTSHAEGGQTTRLWTLGIGFVVCTGMMMLYFYIATKPGPGDLDE